MDWQARSPSRARSCELHKIMQQGVRAEERQQLAYLALRAMLLQLSPPALGLHMNNFLVTIQYISKELDELSVLRSSQL